MITLEEVTDRFTEAVKNNPYFERIEVTDKPYTYNGKVHGGKAVSIWYDLAPDLKIVNEDKTIIRTDYEISDITLEDNWNTDNFTDHLTRLFWMQAANDIADCVVSADSKLRLEVTGTPHPDIQSEIDRLKYEESK